MRYSQVCPAWLARHSALLGVLLAMALVGFVRLRVADVPLERDEGEYAYAGQLILQGIPPYQLVYNMKFPGTYYAYSLILALFGQTPWGIHVGLLFVNAATTLLLFFLGRKLLGEFAAASGAAAFAALSIDRWIMGVFAHATHFVLLPMVAGLLVLRRAMDSQRPANFLAGGALLGTAVLMKQQSLFFLPLGLGLVLWSERRRMPRDIRGSVVRAAMTVAGGALPFAVLCVLLGTQGVLGKFWFWTFQYAKEYVSEIPVTQAGHLFVSAWKGIARDNLAIWLLSLAGILALWLTHWSREARVFLTGLLAASLLAICPGFYFREHYFILLLPVAGLFVGVAVTSLRQVLARILPVRAASLLAVSALIAATATYAFNEREYLLWLSARDLSRTRYGGNPFIEAVDIAAYIRQHAGPEDRIAVLGSEPEIYFYAKRKSATGYIYTYPLMEPQEYAARMQAEMIHEIEAAHPRYLVLVAIGTSWLSRPDSNHAILTWANRYVERCYDQVGIADIYAQDKTALLWDGDVAGYRPRSQNLVYTYLRKADTPCGVGP